MKTLKIPAMYRHTPVRVRVCLCKITSVKLLK